MGKFSKNPPKSTARDIQAHEAKKVSTQQESPLFSLKYLDRKSNYSLAVCTKDEKAALADTLFKLSQLTWAQITNSPREGLGSMPLS